MSKECTTCGAMKPTWDYGKEAVRVYIRDDLLYVEADDDAHMGKAFLALTPARAWSLFDQIDDLISAMPEVTS